MFDFVRGAAGQVELHHRRGRRVGQGQREDLALVERAIAVEEERRRARLRQVGDHQPDEHARVAEVERPRVQVGAHEGRDELGRRPLDLAGHEGSIGDLRGVGRRAELLDEEEIAGVHVAAGEGQGGAGGRRGHAERDRRAELQAIEVRAALALRRVGIAVLVLAARRRRRRRPPACTPPETRRRPSSRPPLPRPALPPLVALPAEVAPPPAPSARTNARPQPPVTARPAATPRPIRLPICLIAPPQGVSSRWRAAYRFRRGARTESRAGHGVGEAWGSARSPWETAGRRLKPPCCNPCSRGGSRWSCCASRPRW